MMASRPAKLWLSIGMRGYDLTDVEWRVIEPLLPNTTRGVPRADDRCMLNGIFRRAVAGPAGIAVAGAGRRCVEAADGRRRRRMTATSR